MTQAVVPAQTTQETRDCLEDLAVSCNGTAVEVGAWLGACTIALLKGLNRNCYAADGDCSLSVYDRWRATRLEVEKARSVGVEIEAGQDLRPLFLTLVEPYREQIPICAFKCEAQLHVWSGKPIGLFVIDAAKQHLAQLLRNFDTGLEPGITFIALLDLHYPKCTSQREIVEYNRDNLRSVFRSTNSSAEVFELTGHLKV